MEAPDHLIARALSLDGRMPFELLAEHAGVGPVAVRRRLSKMEDAGIIALRCDISRRLSGHAVAAVYFGSLDVRHLEEAEGRIRTLPRVRACSLVAGPFAEVHGLERELSQALPALRIHDRSVVLRTVKLLGRVLDAEGRSVRSVPLLAPRPRRPAGQPPRLGKVGKPRHHRERPDQRATFVRRRERRVRAAHDSSCVRCTDRRVLLLPEKGTRDARVPDSLDHVLQLRCRCRS